MRIFCYLKKDIPDKETKKIVKDVFFFFYVLLIAAYTTVFWEKYIRYWYSILFIAVIMIGMHYAERLSPDEKSLYLCGTGTSFLCFFATLLLTNLELIASVPYLLIAAVMAFLPIGKVVQRNKAVRTAVICGICFLAFRNIYMIRPMSGDASAITLVRGIVKDGPAKGIISEYMGPYMQNASMEEWKQYIREGSNIFLIGGSLDTLGYLYSDTGISAPSLEPTPGYNERILEYWRINPDKYPDVVIASCWYGTMNSELEQNEWILRWIEEDFQPVKTIDGKYWRYYFKTQD